MISLSQARALIEKKLRPLPAQMVSLEKVAGRALREDIFAREDLPAFDRSAMDGYAVLPDGRHLKQFRLIGEIRPGEIPKFEIRPGECARVFTGAAIPRGATHVLPQENVRAKNNFITPLKQTAATFIRKRGEDARKGDLLLKSGMRLGAGELALLASLGIIQPKVSPPVRVAHFATGNELIEPSQKPKPGQIRDSNGSLVAALVRQFGGEIIAQKKLADDFDLLLKNVRVAKNKFDLLLISGGASVGDYDFGKKLLNALGFEIHFEKIALRPGKPLIFATRKKSGTGILPVQAGWKLAPLSNQTAFILPGNPVSHFVTLHAVVRLAFEIFSGANISWPLAKIRLAEHFEFRPDARETFWPARVAIENGELAVRALRWQSSGDVTGLAGANSLLRFAGGAKSPKAGDKIETLLLEIP
ncbi:MAG: molybdopterin molybdotransferase MoeA [Limisphaerales bacterium]